MSDPIDNVIRDGVETNRELAAAEKNAARRMQLGPYRWWLTAAVIIWLVYLVLPHAGPVRGYEVTFRLPAAVDANVKITEYVYSWLMLAGIGILTTLVLITRRTALGLIAWMFSGVALFYYVLALWLRQTRSATEVGLDAAIGLYISIISVALTVVAYAMVALRRSPEQQKLADARAEHDNLDEVGYAQREAMVTKQNTSYESNPLFVDDRRQRAAERHPEPTEKD